MAGTFLCPKTCGFAKVAALEVAKGTVLPRDEDECTFKYQGRLKLEQYKQFKTCFSSDDIGDAFSIEFLQFHKKLPGLKQAFFKWNTRKTAEKSKYLDKFSQHNWQSLSDTRKKEHSFANCKGCAVRYMYAEVQAYFPVRSPLLKAKAKKNPVFAAESEAQKLKKTKSPLVKPLAKDISNTANAIYEKVDSEFQDRFNTSFAEGLSKVPKLNIQQATPNERRKKRRKLYKNSKENVEKQMEETALLRCVNLKNH